mgnify:CR=1 FL=1
MLTLILMSLPDKLLDFDSKDFLLLIVVIFEMSINACMSLNNLSYLTQKEFADPTKTLAQEKRHLILWTSRFIVSTRFIVAQKTTVLHKT